MEIVFKKIFEHDMDLLIIEEFLCNRDFARLFLNKINMNANYEDCDAYHSLSDVDGESDITFVLHYGEKKYGILIEDKIDAQTMTEQSSRYSVRAEKQREQGKYDEYSIFIAAPSSYLEEHKKDKNANYSYCVTYEEMMEHFESQNNTRALYKSNVIKFALEEKRKGYVVDPDIKVSEFWKKLRRYCEENFPGLDMIGADKERGSSARWPEFGTAIKNVKIIYKSDRGVIDMEFPGYGDKISMLMDKIGHLLGKEYIVKTGKSASMRVKNTLWKVEFKDDFEDVIENIHSVLTTINEMHELSIKISRVMLY